MYCLRCKSKQIPKNLKGVITKNQTYMLNGSCSKCSTKMNQFVSKKAISGDG